MLLHVNIKETIGNDLLKDYLRLSEQENSGHGRPGDRDYENRPFLIL
jgi:hypothetical protein